MISNNFIESNGLKSIEFLKKLPTPRLLAYYKKHKGLLHSSTGMCDCGCGEYLSDIYDLTPEEKQYYNERKKYIKDIKTIINTRYGKMAKN